MARERALIIVIAKDGCVWDFALGQRLDDLEEGLEIVSMEIDDMHRNVRFEYLELYRR